MPARDQPPQKRRKTEPSSKQSYKYSSASDIRRVFQAEVVIKDNVKTVTLRSTYKVENQTFYPLEVAMVDNTGHPVSSIDKIGTRQPDQIFHVSDPQESSWRGLRITN